MPLALVKCDNLSSFFKKDTFMLVGFIILISCQLLGHCLVSLLALPIPAPVVGLVILFAVLLIRGYIPDPLVKVATNLLPLLPLFLIPASTGIIQYGDLLKDEWFPITVAISVSMIASVAVIPFVFLFFSKLFGKR